MTEPLRDRFRPWREIARELARESGRQRIAELSGELNTALEQQEFNSEQTS